MKKEEFEERIGYRFQNIQLLQDALCHSSFCGAQNSTFDRMEYLGDAVLELIISNFLYDTFPDYSEGMLTKVRTGIVSEGSLSIAAKEIGIDQAIVLGKGEEHSGGRGKPSILSDAYEAVTGAIYLDGGLEAAKTFVLGSLKENIASSIRHGGVEDYKTKLQEYLQSKSTAAIEYRTAPVKNAVGPQFHSSVYHDGEMLGSGTGNRKKTAEQMAARDALKRLGV